MSKETQKYVASVETRDGQTRALQMKSFDSISETPKFLRFDLQFGEAPGIAFFRIDDIAHFTILPV